MMIRRHSCNPLVLTALAAVLFAAGPRPARAHLDVSAPTDAQVQALGAWYEQHVPARFRAREAVDVSALTDREMTAYLRGGDDADAAASRADDGDGDIDGVFEDGPPRITLRLPASGEPDMFTFAHEYGHYVWFALLNKGDRRRYEVIYNKQRAGHHLVTRYAETELEEGFAEAFSFFVNQPPLLAHRDPLSYQFLAQWGVDAHSK
ncbi:MAG: hypothetical protein JO250_02815 [Armatimonadetes bacterium]|nr:hypothetical protein [Armatimonadota bacterium]